MLDVIADFWKPVKKAQQQEVLQPDLLQIGSSLGFGFVPQALLSGRRLHVTAINTYLFGDEALTSFVLTQEKEPGVSMIVAESDGEYYLAISRRISLNDRMKLFEVQELEGVMNRPDQQRLNSRDHIIDYKGWMVASYKREIQGLKGAIFKGDFRKTPLPAVKEAQEFEYTLLVSDSNEHAIEIEKYNDGRIEVYATVYRRLNDIGEITHPVVEKARPDIKLASAAESTISSSFTAAPKLQEAEPLKSEPVKVAPIQLQEFITAPAAQAANTAAPVPAAPAEPAAAIKEITLTPPEANVAPGVFTVSNVQEEHPMATPTNAINGASTNMSTAEAIKPKLYVQPNTPDAYGQDVKAIPSKAMNSFDADAIECDLRVANKIIDEAIRNEMRLTDIVRRIIELPVAYPESVQIPVTLTDEDYALLAIRYGISSSDRNAIKRRIIDDLNDFSGGKKKAA
jgi:hypothetical protein